MEKKKKEKYEKPQLRVIEVGDSGGGYRKPLVITICGVSEEMFDDPLRNVHGKFDIIIVQEVFEHLHAPLHIAEYLIERLKVGGLLSFDYALTKGFGYDTPISIEQRHDTLKFLEKHLKFIYGDFLNDDQKLGSYIGIKEM